MHVSYNFSFMRKNDELIIMKPTYQCIMFFVSFIILNLESEI